MTSHSDNGEAADERLFANDSIVHQVGPCALPLKCRTRDVALVSLPFIVRQLCCFLPWGIIPLRRLDLDKLRRLLSVATMLNTYITSRPRPMACGICDLLWL